MKLQYHNNSCLSSVPEHKNNLFQLWYSETTQWSNTDLKALNVRCDIQCDIDMIFLLCVWCNEDSEFGFKSLSAKELLARMNLFMLLIHFSFLITGHLSSVLPVNWQVTSVLNSPCSEPHVFIIQLQIQTLQ